MNGKHNHRMATAWLALSLIVACGCGSRGDANSVVTDQSNGRDSLLAEQVSEARAVGRPLSPDARVSAVAVEIPVAHGPFPELNVEPREGVVIPRGDTGAAHRDAETGKIAWRAYTCLNPNCSGETEHDRPHLFSRPVEAIKELPDGRVVLLQLPAEEMSKMIGPTCPACNTNRWTGLYEPPEVAERRVLLDTELAASRAARRDAKRADTGMPTDHRTPMAIMRDLAALPKLYLVADK